MINENSEKIYNEILKSYPEKLTKLDELEIMKKYLDDYFEHEIVSALFKAKQEKNNDYDLLK